MKGGDRRLRVLQVGKYYPPAVGGIETHVATLARGLRDHVDVEVAVAAEGRRSSVEERDGVRVTRLGTLATFRSAPLCAGLPAAIRAAAADIVHLHLPSPGAALAYLASRHGGRLVVTYHSDVVRQRVLGAVVRPLTERVLEASSAILVSSPQLLSASTILPRYAGRCRVIPFGIEAGPLSPEHRARARTLRRLHGPRQVLAVGRLVYYKGFEFLIDAMREVDAHLVLVGEGPLLPALVERVRRHGLAGRVTFAGRVESLVPYFHAADVFAFPSIAHSETFGLVQVEAMLAGIPVVNTALDTGVPFVSLHERTGLTVPPRDAAALARAIRRLLDDAPLRAALGAAARERAEAEFTAARMVDRTLEVYRSIVDSAAERVPSPLSA